MTIRRATADDLALLEELWREFEAEVPEPPHREQQAEVELAEIPGYFEEGAVALLAELDGSAVGYALAKLQSRRICFLSDLYVRPAARRRGVARALMASVVDWGVERGADVMTLEVLSTNTDARTMYDRIGFTEEMATLVAPLDRLSERLVDRAAGVSYGSIHVQTDDALAVRKSVEIYVPRLPGGSRGSVIAPPRNGWTAVYDELCDREPEMLRRLAVDLSNRMAPVVLLLGVEHDVVVRYVLLERGRIVDEYLSVPEYYGPIPPGDVIGLGANPTVAHRLTGADPARVKDLARIARSPGDLPPPGELFDQLAELFGLEGTVHGYEEAVVLSGATVLERAPEASSQSPPA
jgi:ribosomal protein S18 acetylase RimI-like enzyme